MFKNFRRKCSTNLMLKSDYLIKAASSLKEGYNLDCDPAAKCVFHNLVSKALLYDFLDHLIYFQK